MKPARPQESKCRRLEFKCKLYDIIKDLEKSLVSECDMRQGGPQRGNVIAKSHEAQRQAKKGSECCCPAGCCKESMVFKSPKLPPNMDPASAGARADSPAAGSQQLAPSDYEWHQHDHGRGCRPDRGGPGGREGPGPCCYGESRRGGPQGGPSSQGGPGGQGGPGPCFYGESRPAVPQGAPAPNKSPGDFRFPQSAEEAIQMGCFVARTC